VPPGILLPKMEQQHPLPFYIHIILLLMSTTLWAQQIEVSGHIVDAQGISVPFASVIFKSKTVDSIVYGVLGDEDGAFNISLKREVYDLEVSVVGLKSYSKTIDLTQSTPKTDLGSIVISTDIALDEVIIKADGQQRIALDKKIYNVTKDLQVSGGSLVDVMQNLPSVQVEVDGAVSIRGDGNVQILVDGHVSGLTSTAAFLRTIPAGSIDRIEVIINPSSRYNANGTGGIINVVLKKGKKKQFTGSAEVFSGIRINSGLNVNLNRGGEKTSWYYNGGFGYSEPRAWSKLKVDNFQASTPDFEQTSERILEQFYVLNNLGGKWRLNEKHTFTLDLTYRIAELDNRNDIQYTYLSNGAITAISTRSGKESYRNNYIQARGNYELQLNDTGSALDFGLMEQLSNEEGRSTIWDSIIFPNTSILNIDRVLNNVTERRHIFSVDWVHPFSKTSQLEMGMRNGIVNIENDFEVSRNDMDRVFTIPEFTDNTAYDQNILAFYSQYAKRFDKFSFQLGLRSETTNIVVHTSDSKEKISYTDLFPSGYLDFGFNEGHSVRLSVSRRISRPSHSTLIPFSSFDDSRNIRVGNPTVNPTYAIVSELGYNGKFSDTFSVTPALFYRHSNDIQDYFIEKVTIDINGEPHEVYRSTKVNIGKSKTLGLELSASYKPLTWFNLYTAFSASYFEQVGQYQDKNFNSTGIASIGRLHFNFDVSESLKLELQHRFRGGNERGQFKRKSVYRMDAALSKKMFHNKGLLTINAKDIFNTWKFNITTNGKDFHQTLITQIRTPQLNVAFSYLFNQKKYKGKKGQQYDKLD